MYAHVHARVVHVLWCLGFFGASVISKDEKRERPSLEASRFLTIQSNHSGYLGILFDATQSSNPDISDEVRSSNIKHAERRSEIIEKRSVYSLPTKKSLPKPSVHVTYVCSLSPDVR